MAGKQRKLHEECVEVILKTLNTMFTHEKMLQRSRFDSLAVGSAAPLLYSLGCLCLKIINGPRRLFLMKEREENELCHLLMGDLGDERQKAGKQITSQKALVLICEKKKPEKTKQNKEHIFFLNFFKQCQHKCLLQRFQSVQN